MARRSKLLHKCEDHRWCLRKGHYEHTLPSIPEDREFGAEGLLLLKLPGCKAKHVIDQPDQDQDQAKQILKKRKHSTVSESILSKYISESKLHHDKKQKKDIDELSTLPPRPCSMADLPLQQFLAILRHRSCLKPAAAAIVSVLAQ